eukprot:symbB.v1.2.006084.t1/scaffold350.1/size222032/2
MFGATSATSALWYVWKQMFALKRRIFCFIILSFFIIASITDLYLLGESTYAPSLLGLCCGLLLGIVHIPEAGVLRDVPRGCKILACTILCGLTVYAATYPWHLHPRFGDNYRPMSRRWIMLWALLTVAAVYVLCLLKAHPPSNHAHDAKWCIFGIWLSTMLYQLHEAARAYHSDLWTDFALAFGISVDSVVLGWVVIMFQSRIRVLRATSSGVASKFWIYVMCTSFIANSVFTVVQRAFSTTVGMIGSILVRTIFLSIWAAYTVMVSRTLSRGLYVLWMESRRVRGLPKKQVQWAARVLRLELLICATLGSTTFIVWATINAVKVVQLVDREEYDRIKMKVWFYVSILRRFDGVLNALELAALSGILWQGSPPEGHEDVEMESRARLRGLTSMSDFLEVDEQAKGTWGLSWYCMVLGELSLWQSSP